MAWTFAFVDATSHATMRTIDDWDPTGRQSHSHTFCLRADPRLLFTFHVEEQQGPPRGVGPSLQIDWIWDGDGRTPVLHVSGGACAGGSARPCSAEVTCAARASRLIFCATA
jgi:hypothetical protein